MKRHSGDKHMPIEDVVPFRTNYNDIAAFVIRGAPRDYRNSTREGTR